jgi:hypothetical protein
MGRFRMQRLVYLLSPCNRCGHLRRRQILSTKILVDLDQLSMQVVDVPDDSRDLFLVKKDKCFVTVATREDFKELAIATIG